MKKAVLILLSALLVVSTVISGCGLRDQKTEGKPGDNFDSASSKETSSASQKVTITYICDAYWPERLQQINQQFFSKQHPNIEVKMEGYPFDQIFEVIEVKLGAGDTQFDVIAVDVPMVAGYGFRDYLLPLDEYFTKEEKEKIIPSAVEAGTYNGKFLAPPMMSSSQLLYYNKDILQKAGIQFPSEDVNQRWTWEKISDASMQVMQKLNPDGKSGIWGFTFEQISRPYQILALPNSLGAKGIGDDGVTVDGVLNSSEWIKAMTYYYDLHNTWKVSPKGLKPGETNELFKSGKMAFFVGGPWNISQFEEVKDLKWGVAPHPYFEGAKPATPTGSWHYGVNKNSKHPKEAVEWIKYMSIGEGSEKWFEADGNLPATKALLNSIIDDKDGKYKEFPKSAYKITAYEAMNTAFPRPLTPGYREWDTTVTATLEDIRNGADPKTALEDAVARLKTALTKYKK